MGTPRAGCLCFSAATWQLGNLGLGGVKLENNGYNTVFFLET